MPFSYLRPNDQVEIWRNQTDGLGELSFQGLSDKTDLVSHLAPSTNAEVEERIDASVSWYITESSKDIFKPDMVFESFHLQARIPISDRALLVRFS